MGWSGTQRLYIVDDIILESEGIIDVAYSDPGNQGSWSAYDTISAFSTYFMDVADLNNDGLLDLITTDDTADRYYLNQGVGDDDMADFLSFVYTYSHTGTGGAAGDDGFGDETVAIDLDKDGWLDVLTFDVDFEVPGCARRAHIYHNLGGQPGDNVNLQEQTTGSGCQNFLGNPETCLVASIPADKLVGTYDIATFDINGDSWPDLVIGRCSGTEIYMSQRPAGGAGSVPDGSVVPGSMLTIDKAGTEIALSWGNSCTVADNDFAIYQGEIASGFESHSQVTCSTGRGNAAGQGNTAGRGNKGQKSRSGGGPPVWFEGGQLPLIKGLPMKRGFHNRFKTYYSLIKVETLESFVRVAQHARSLLENVRD